MSAKNADSFGSRPVTLAFLGDSITHGCFELKPLKAGGNLEVFDYENVYHAQVKKILALLYPRAQVNIINGGVSGDTAEGALKRIDRDILSFSPDYTVVCLGVNDHGYGMGMLETYISSLSQIFDKIRAAGSRPIFMTPCLTADKVPSIVCDERTEKLCADMNTKERRADLLVFIESAKKLCKEKEIPICDCFENWKLMENAGVDIGVLHSNHINHPIRQMHTMFAYELVKLLLTL